MNKAHAKPIIGLIGAPGSGKSLVARQLAQLGCAVIDADALARDVLEEPQVIQQIADWWGPQVLDASGRVDRQALGRVVFNNRAELDRLEGLVHPRVHARRRQLRAQYEADPHVRAIVEDCPLLLEKELADDCDVLIYIDAPEAVRLGRVRAQRGWTARELQEREKNQWPLDMKRQRADYVIDNSASEAETFDQVRRVLSLILHGRSQPA
ncbi:MAG TPA: dephospho-CoA kinase [Phycisphaeraceae bacterium]